MRFFEIVVSGLLFLYLIWPWLSKRRRSWIVNLLPVLALVGIVIHLAVEGLRWQMVPVYALTGLTTLLALPGLKRQPEQSFRVWSWSSLATLTGLLILIAGIVTALLLPVKDLPCPNGPYKVGVTSLELVDGTRPEIYSEAPGQKRRLMVQIWYPGLPEAQAKPAAWLPDAAILAPAIATYSGFPPFFLDHLQWVRTNSYLEAELDPAGKPYPLLLFSHGWNGWRGQNVHHMEELASHGYIVVSIDHPYAAIATVFPDGLVALNNPQILPEQAPDEQLEPAAQILGKQWQEDIAFALDSLAKWNNGQPPTPFVQAIDLGRVGIFGHSTGAGASMLFCAQDQRCTAGLTLDAWMGPVPPEIVQKGVSQPFLYIFSEFWPSPRNKELFADFCQQSAQTVGIFTILGSGHYDFLDPTLLPPAVQFFNLKGPIPTARMADIIDLYSLSFFDWALKGKATPLFSESASAFAEVQKKDCFGVKAAPAQ